MIMHRLNYLQPIKGTSPAVAWFYYVLQADDYVSEFCVANGNDPDQYVCTLAPDGSEQRWAKREKGDLLVFTPPDGYRVSEGVDRGLLWAYDRRLQIGEAMPRKELEKLALRNRVSVDMGGS